MTLLAVVVTANHFILDGVGGLLCLAVGWVLAFALDRRFRPASSTEQAAVRSARAPVAEEAQVGVPVQRT
jgi:membrane-associated phospholipid phosphatase